MKKTLAVVAALFLLAGCGNGAASGGGNPDQKSIRLAYQAFPSGDLIVKNQGLLEKALPDYKITWTKFDSGASINTAFVAGSLDIAAIGSSPVARGLSAPLNIPYQVAFVRDVFAQHKPVGVICHGGWILTDADVLHGRTLTSYPSLRTDLTNAGATWVDEEVVVDSGLVTSRNPDDIPAFTAKAIEEFAEGAHEDLPQPTGAAAS